MNISGKPLLEKGELKKIKDMKKEFERLYKYERDLNDYGFSNRDNFASYKKKLQNMNKILNDINNELVPSDTP